MAVFLLTITRALKVGWGSLPLSINTAEMRALFIQGKIEIEKPIQGILKSKPAKRER